MLPVKGVSESRGVPCPDSKRRVWSWMFMWRNDLEVLSRPDLSNLWTSLQGGFLNRWLPLCVASLLAELHQWGQAAAAFLLSRLLWMLPLLSSRTWTLKLFRQERVGSGWGHHMLTVCFIFMNICSPQQTLRKSAPVLGLSLSSQSAFTFELKVQC